MSEKRVFNEDIAQQAVQLRSANKKAVEHLGNVQKQTEVAEKLSRIAVRPAIARMLKRGESGRLQGELDELRDADASGGFSASVVGKNPKATGTKTKHSIGIERHSQQNGFDVSNLRLFDEQGIPLSVPVSRPHYDKVRSLTIKEKQVPTTRRMTKGEKDDLVAHGSEARQNNWALQDAAAGVAAANERAKDHLRDNLDEYYDNAVIEANNDFINRGSSQRINTPERLMEQATNAVARQVEASQQQSDHAELEQIPRP